MTDDEKAARAMEADRLLRDDTLTEALDAMRQAGLEQLLQMPADDATQITKWQAYVAAVDGFRGQLGLYVAQAKQRTARGGLA